MLMKRSKIHYLLKINVRKLLISKIYFRDKYVHRTWIVFTVYKVSIWLMII